MDARRFSPSTARNAAPILAVLKDILPDHGRVLELASGSGEHAVIFARAMPGIAWQTSDPDPEARTSTAAWIAHEALGNAALPIALDVNADDWGVEGAFDAIVAINMIHYSPLASTPALFKGASKLLRPGGTVFLYGPYKRDGRHTAPSNEAFDVWLKERDPAFGVRHIGDVEREAGRFGFFLRKTIEMPANNLSLVFAR